MWLAPMSGFFITSLTTFRNSIISFRHFGWNDKLIPTYEGVDLIALPDACLNHSKRKTDAQEGPRNL